MGTYLRLTPSLLDVLTVLVHAEEPVWGLRVSVGARRPTGTVYPLLERLERSGLASSQWEESPGRPGPRRRLYVLTPSGRAWAGEQLIHKGRLAAVSDGRA